jgi:urea transporter
MFHESHRRVPVLRLGPPLALQNQLTAIAQIYLQSSPVFGTVVLLCLYLTAPALALGCLLGACAASASAWVLGFPDEDRKSGLYSFNGALSGAGLSSCYQSGSALLGWIILIGVITAILARAMQRRGIPALTSLFVGAMWMTMAAAPALGLEPLLPPAAQVHDLGPCGWVVRVVGQVAFIGLTPFCMLVWASLTHRQWRQGAWMLAGAALAWSAAAAWDGASESLLRGMGINSALTALALTVFNFSRPVRLVGAVTSILLSIAFDAIGLPSFTLPFVLATWLFLRLDSVREG